jgi:predicted regulator of Ras-like GTPase activity (Roadblock/LC7/MglB family)
VEHRLRLCGWHDDPKFTGEVFSDIYEFTQGVPRRINTLCNRLLLYACVRELHAIDREMFACVAQDLIEEQGGVAATGVESVQTRETADGGANPEPTSDEPGKAAAPRSRPTDTRGNTPHPTDGAARFADQRRTGAESSALVDDSQRASRVAHTSGLDHIEGGGRLSSPSNSRETPMERTESLNKILKNLQSGSPDVEASALITEDGLIIASSLPQDLDEVTVGGMSATLLHLGTRAATALHRGDVREVIVRGEEGYGVMVSAGRGVLLLVVANENAKLGLIFYDMRAAISAIKKVL